LTWITFNDLHNEGRFKVASGGMRSPPRWLFTVLAVGGLLAAGLYLGLIHAEGSSTGYFLRAIGFGALGALMMWGAIGRR